MGLVVIGRVCSVGDRSDVDSAILSPGFIPSAGPCSGERSYHSRARVSLLAAQNKHDEPYLESPPIGRMDDDTRRMTVQHTAIQ